MPYIISLVWFFFSALSFQALSSESIEKLPVFNKSAFKHYQMSSEADDWCIPSKEPKNLAKENVAVWWGTLRTLEGIKVGLQQCCFLNVCMWTLGPSKTNNCHKNSLSRTPKGRGAKLFSVTQESTVQDYSSEQMASSLFFSLRIMLGFISNPKEHNKPQYFICLSTTMGKGAKWNYRLRVSGDWYFRPMVGIIRY